MEMGAFASPAGRAAAYANATNAFTAGLFSVQHQARLPMEWLSSRALMVVPLQLLSSCSHYCVVNVLAVVLLLLPLLLHTCTAVCGVWDSPRVEHRCAQPAFRADILTIVGIVPCACILR